MSMGRNDFSYIYDCNLTAFRCVFILRQLVFIHSSAIKMKTVKIRARCKPACPRIELLKPLLKEVMKFFRNFSHELAR